MTTTRLRRGVDAWIAQADPIQNNGDSIKLMVTNAAAAARYAYLYFAGGPRPGVYVTSATLRLHTRTAWTGATSVTVRRIVASWRASTLTWRRAPATTATNEVVHAIGAVNGGALIEIDVTDIVRTAYLGSGAPFYGFRITTNNVNNVGFHASEVSDPDKRPELEVVFTWLPTQAYDLVPGDGSVVSVPEPVLRWTYYDADENEQAAAWVQIDDVDTFATPTFDSGWVVTADPELDLATTAFGSLTNGQVVWWRVKVRNADGQEGDWSDPVQITRTSKGVLSINAPTAFVQDTTPEIATTLIGRAQAALAYELKRIIPLSAPAEEALAARPQKVTAPLPWRSGRFAAVAADGARYESEVPPGKITRWGSDWGYRLTVWSWDNVADRVATPGDPIYSQAVVDFSVVASSQAPSGPGTLTVTQEVVTIADGSQVRGPGVLLSWTRNAVPDYWQLVIDGEIVLDKIDALELQLASPTEYAVTWFGAEPGFAHTYEVRALEVT